MTRKILICDDEPHIRRLIEQSLEELEDEGVEIFSAADGEEALSQIEGDRPDLIILDVMMPNVNGADVCNKVTRNENICQALFLLLTAKGQLRARLRAAEDG